MARIGPIEDNNLDERTKSLLDKVNRAWGGPWNITSGMAHNPAVIEAFLTIGKLLAQAGLSPMDRPEPERLRAHRSALRALRRHRGTNRTNGGAANASCF